MKFLSPGGPLLLHLLRPLQREADPGGGGGGGGPVLGRVGGHPGVAGQARTLPLLHTKPRQQISRNY